MAASKTIYGLYHYAPRKDEEGYGSLCAISYDPVVFEQMKYDLTHKEEYASFGYDSGEFIVKAVIACNLFTKFVQCSPFGGATKQYDLHPVDLNCINVNNITFYGANIATNIENDGKQTVVIFDAIVFGNKVQINDILKTQEKKFNTHFNISINPLEFDTIYPEGVVNA